MRDISLFRKIIYFAFGSQNSVDHMRGNPRKTAGGKFKVTLGDYAAGKVDCIFSRVRILRGL
jgi:hypothetical protein